ncbi:hypothetical protein [Rhizobium sp. WYCCWR 11146]|nr:hypothetical protein [Rhizobium sp. WYCCWR 11146]MBA1347226.1 hypothetical protein [Rhizobium sp. WYCCWR 11146]
MAYAAVLEARQIAETKVDTLRAAVRLSEERAKAAATEAQKKAPSEGNKD